MAQRSLGELRVTFTSDVKNLLDGLGEVRNVLISMNEEFGRVQAKYQETVDKFGKTAAGKLLKPVLADASAVGQISTLKTAVEGLTATLEKMATAGTSVTGIMAHMDNVLRDTGEGAARTGRAFTGMSQEAKAGVLKLREEVVELGKAIARTHSGGTERFFPIGGLPPTESLGKSRAEVISAIATTAEQARAQRLTD